MSELAVEEQAQQKALTGKVAIVTGGTRGIGRAIAAKFAQEGAKVVIFGRNKERGELAVTELRQVTGSDTISFYSVDVANTEEVSQTIDAVIEEFSQVDILVNNAGITQDSLLMRMGEGAWDSVIETNLKSVYNMCHALIRRMMKARGGKIINVSSVVGLVGGVGQTNYAASKSGMIGFTKSLAQEVAGRNICVNCIAPGFIGTDMTDALTDQQKVEILRHVPMGRMGDPMEIANAALFLASGMSSYITGHVLTVAGGMVMN